MKRYLLEQISLDIQKKMVFLGGPRQVGKTTLAKQLISTPQSYLNWDIVEDKEKFLKRELPDLDFLIFDEIHKYKLWRNYLKGLFDKYGKSKKILVTGSARLDLYRYGGDSLQGRYHYLRLHPLSVAELKIASQEDFMALLNLSGFPEPFFSGSEVEYKRWSREYRTRLLNEEINSIERIHDLGTMELLAIRLPDLVASPLSVNSLREDLHVSFKVVSRWIDLLERFYAIIRLAPFNNSLIKSVRKEKKHYHFDWSVVSDPPKRFENLVAMHLLKYVHYEQDTKGRELDLKYYRDIERREVDFIITENLKPILAIECKWTDEEISPSLKYFKNKFPKVKTYQLSAIGKKDYLSKEDIRVCPALDFLKTLV
jgi:uncharacterized protein